MGAGRKTKSYNLKEKSQPPLTVNQSVTARNLRKSDLGGVIFGCKHNTIKECLSNQLFGLPAPHFAYVKNVTPGLPLFLFNYSDRTLHGIFEAVSPGQLNINPYGWTSDDVGTTPYPAQVRFRIQKQCQPLIEDQFGAVIVENYYEPRLFWFELDQKQTHELIKLFLASPAPNNVFPSKKKAMCNAMFLPPSDTSEQADYGKSTSRKERFSMEKNMQCSSQSTSALGTNLKSNYELSASVLGSSNVTGQAKTWSSLFKSTSNSDPTERSKITETHTLGLNLPQSSQSMIESNSSGDSLSVVEDSQLYEIWEDQCDLGYYEEPLESSSCVPSSMPTKVVQTPEASMPNHMEQIFSESDIVVTAKDSESNSSDLQIAQTPEVSMPYHMEHIFSESDIVETAKDPESNFSDLQLAQNPEAFMPNNMEQIFPESDVTVTNDPESNSFDYQMVVEKLLKEIEVLRVSQMCQNLRISSLEQELIGSKFQIQHLKIQSSILASGPSSSSGGLIKEDDFELLHNHPPEVDASVLVIGGFNGSSWLSAVDTYSFSHDLIKSLSQMTFARSYATVSKLNGEVCVFGGANGDIWYDTAESYCPAFDKWITLPSLNKKKGSMAGASLTGKIFAFGGGNGVECFSEVEMFDNNIGRWICIQPMSQKRFAPAAAEIDGALYVVGGFDGRNYLDTVERFDLREHKWTKMGNMSTRRGCHSLVALNGKLFALGGYDGSKMVSIVEKLDPRFGSWMRDESMHTSRGYSGAVAINGKIYNIGGVKDGGEILDTVECYKEGYGWQMTNLKAIGKRCFFTALVL